MGRKRSDAKVSKILLPSLRAVSVQGDFADISWFGFLCICENYLL